MQIDIDFDVFKALTALRESEADTYNSVLRRVVGLPANDSVSARPDTSLPAKRRGLMFAGPPTNVHGLGASWLDKVKNAAIFDGVVFPEGTKFRSIYKGTPHYAEISNGRWVDQDGVVRSSPSAAASAISNTNVNGWRFWFALRPGDSEWLRLDALK